MNTGQNGIDWEELRNRLKQGQFAQGVGMDRQEVEAVFRRRAERLAKPKAPSDAASRGLSVLAFRLGQEGYAIELNELAEVLPFAGCVSLPGASPELLGMINLRGELRPVVDLAVLLELPRGTEEGSGHTLLLRRQTLGLRVGAVDEIRGISPEELVVPGASSAILPTRYAKGLIPGTLTLLDPEKILSHPLFKETVG